ncbi:hypothetical protein CAPTEDRAFT_27515, partial [Capitella teleta]
IGLTLNTFYLPFIITFGSVGNVLSLIVLSSKKTKNRPLSKYMMALAVADCVMLLVAGYQWVRILVHRYLHDGSVQIGPSSIECKFVVHIYNAASLTGAFYIMVMTLDQFFCVKFPLRSAAICTASRAKKIIIIVPLAVSVYCIPQFLYA